MHSTFIFLAVENLFFSIKRSIDSEKIRMFIKSEMTYYLSLLRVQAGFIIANHKCYFCHV